ncbi:hypothetical protein ACFQ0G_00715 [Streptomyces chiangmaiensis]
MSTATIPFGARAAAPPCLVTTSIKGVTWNEGRQLNIQADGTPGTRPTWPHRPPTPTWTARATTSLTRTTRPRHDRRRPPCARRR